MSLQPWEVYASGNVRDQDQRLSIVTPRESYGKTTAAISLSSPGDTVIHTPAAGLTLKLFWIGLSSSQNNTAEVLLTVKLGARVIYMWNMGNPGGFSHWEVEQADNPNDSLIVNLNQSGQPVLFNYTYSEALA